MRRKLTKRLQLHRETLAALDREALARVVGGAPTRPLTCGDTCGPTCEGCPPPP